MKPALGFWTAALAMLATSALAQMPEAFVGRYALEGLAACGAPPPLEIRHDGFDINGDPENPISCSIGETFPADDGRIGMMGACRDRDDGSEFASFFTMRAEAGGLVMTEHDDDGSVLFDYRARRCG